MLSSLHEGGFGAYVAASRACTREGLCITETVTAHTERLQQVEI